MSKIITYHGAKLEIPNWLEPLWPYDLPLDKWPTYCGAGPIGDLFVPDTIEGAYVNPACFIHDIDWAVADGKKKTFHRANERFRKNLKEIVSVQITDDGTLFRAYSWCNIYFYVVDSDISGYPNYLQQEYCTDHLNNERVAEKLNRLAHATYKQDM